MDKIILKKIAKDWAKGILFATGMDSFDDDSPLTYEEQGYIVEEVQKIGLKLTDGDVETSLNDIIDKYYDFEDES